MFYLSNSLPEVSRFALPPAAALVADAQLDWPDAGCNLAVCTDALRELQNGLQTELENELARRL